MDESPVSGRQVTVADMADSREARALRQSALLAEYGGCLVCLTMNIAGPIKHNALIARAFADAVRTLRDTLAAYHLRTLYEETRLAFTGPEAFFCVKSDALRVKRLTCALEERVAFGRLLDADVLQSDGTKISRESVGLSPRRCLLCDGPAAPCAAGRKHTAAELFHEATRIMKSFLDKRFFEKTAAFAVRSLLYELAVTPKPGLVDRDNAGSHPDMDFFHFTASAPSLFPYFRNCAEIGSETGATPETFARIRTEGALAEGDMLRATGGVNTHRGAVFTLGILCAAAGSVYAQNLPVIPDSLSRTAIFMTSDTLETERLASSSPHTFGESLQTARLAGARAQAAQGFPGALTGLAVLDAALKEGLSLNDAGVRALLAILIETEDTVLLKRVGPAKAAELKSLALNALRHGATLDEVRTLDQTFIARNASIGGCADLLAAAMFMKLMRDDDLYR